MAVRAKNAEIRTITGNLSGNATSATTATNDTKGQAITSYIRALSISGRTITYTKGDGTTGTITTQDTNTTYTLAGLVGSTAIGSTTQPIYWDGSKFTTIGYTIAKSVPSNAVFTDTNTTYSAGTGLSLSGTTFNHKNSVTAGTAQGDASKTLTFGGTFTIPTVTYDAQGHITSKGTTTMTMPANPNTDTHYTTHLYAGTSSGVANAATTNGNTYLILTDNSTARNRIKITGSGATTVTSDANGVITISSTDTNTNTWRGIQNNLTSDSTTDSLSAAQGKVLKGLVDGKAASSHTHAYLVATQNGTSSLNTNTSMGYFHYKYNVNVGTEGLFDATNNANAVFHFNKHYGNYDSQLGFSNTGRIYYRSCDGNALSTKSWFTLAYTSDLTWNNVSGKPSSFTPASHTHNYAGSSSAGGSATSAVKLDTASAGSATQPVYWTGGKPAACSYTLGKSVPSNAVFTDTTYPVYFKNIDGNYTTAYRTQAKGNSSGGNFITVLRCDTASISGAPQYSSGIGWGRSDTHGYLCVNYSAAQAYIGGGSADKLNWVKAISLDGHTHNYAGSSSAGGAATTALACTGNAATATKLATARSIALGTAVWGTATNFDGSGNITIPVTGVNEAYLSWGGRNIAGGYGPIDAAMVPALGANRLAFGNGNAVTVEYSRDSGSTWTSYGSSAESNKALFSTSYDFGIGKNDSSNKATAAYMLRVTIDTSAYPIYTALNKFVIYVSTNGSSGTYCTIQASLESTPSTWVTFANKVGISGWSGYNVINTSSIVTYGNNASVQYGLVRFIFGCTGGSTTYNGLRVLSIYGYGGVGWTCPSTLAKTGHIYSYDSSQNVSFPAKVTATTFSGGIADVSNGTNTTFAYSKSGMNYGDYTWLAGWNGYELRAVNKNQFATASHTHSGYAASSHTHNYAGSSSAGGSATSAVKLDTASAGSATQPVYWTGGKPAACSYTLGKSVPSNAVFTDTKVTQTAITASDYTNWRPLIWGASNSGTEGFTPSTVTDGVYTANTLSCQPSSGTIRATIFKGALSGNASSATKATQDSAGQQINTTYIKALSVSGKTITYTKGNGTTGTITTQDTNTWRGIQNNLTSDSTTDSLSAAQGKVLKGLVDGKAAASHSHTTVVGSYTGNGGQQNPKYFGVNKVGFLMMNTTINGDAHYKDFIIMDNYAGNDVGGATALGIDRQEMKAFIMGSDAARTSWSRSAELLTTSNYTSYTVKKDGTGASGTWGINVTGSAGSVAWGNVTGKPSTYTPASHTHNYAGSSSAGGAANSLSYFKNTSTTDIGIDDTSANAIGYVKGTSGIMSQSDGAMYKQVYNASWAHEIYGDYVTGQIAVRGKKSGTWQAWRRILDSSNYTSYCTPANIGAAAASHTHNYAGSSSAGGSATSAVKLDTASAGSATQPVYFSGGKPTACTYTLGKSVPSNAVFTDTNTHYTTHLYAGTSSGTANASTTNGNTYLILTDDSTARNRIKIAGSGGTTVTSDASGNITINSATSSSTASGITVTENTIEAVSLSQIPFVTSYSSGTATLTKSGSFRLNLTKTAVGASSYGSATLIVGENTNFPPSNGSTNWVRRQGAIALCYPSGSTTTIEPSAANSITVTLPETSGRLLNTVSNSQQNSGTTDYTMYKFRNIGFGTTSTPTANNVYGGSGTIYLMYS